MSYFNVLAPAAVWRTLWHSSGALAVLSSDKKLDNVDVGSYTRLPTQLQ
jgi:hypothetical protein